MRGSSSTRSATGRRRIRVLHLLYSLGVGGTERRVLRLGLGLDPERYEIHALTLRPVTGARLPWPEDRHTYFPIEPGLQWRRLFGLARLIRRGQYDVVHSHNWGTMFYGVLAARIAGVPLVLHGEHGRNTADRTGISRKRELIAACLARTATRVVAVNEAIAADIMSRWRLPRGRIECVPNGVDLHRFKPRSPDAAANDAFLIGTIARFDGIKNLPCLVRGFELLHERNPELKVRLVLVGEGPDFAAVQAQAQRGPAAGEIDFVGETDEPEDWYPRFDLYANTSLSEGMSNAVLEAMACGVPVVASAIAGNQCWLREGENALFFPSDDASALAEKMAFLARNRGYAEQMGRNNLARVEAEYDNEDFLKRYDGVYRTFFERRHRTFL